MRSKLIYPLFILFSFNSYIAQEDNNLVLNTSFESIDGQLKKLNQINVANDWYSPTPLKADLFTSSVPGAIGTTENIYGKEFPKEGENYAGILTYSYNNKKPRTYLQSLLIKPLASGLNYCVNIHVSLSGNVALSFQNALSYGEVLKINWRRMFNSSQNLIASINHK